LAWQPKGIGRRANNIAQYLTKAGIEYKSKRTKIGAVTTLKKAPKVLILGHPLSQYSPTIAILMKK